MIRPTRPPKDPAAEEMSASLAEIGKKVSHRRTELLARAGVGAAAGGFCIEHHLRVVTQSVCGCEGLHVVPFGVALWTSIDFDAAAKQIKLNYGWGPQCIHGAPLPLSPPVEHDILPPGAYN